MDGALGPSRFLGARGPLVMGIVNVTPDSFSDGGEFSDVHRAVEHAKQLWHEGADWLDIGGESTRPGAVRVSAEEEASRVVPVIEALARDLPEAVISIDTSKASVAKQAIAAGASVVNDVTACGDPMMAPLCAETGVRVVLMHMRGTPRTMQKDTAYTHLVSDVAQWLHERATAVLSEGVAAEKILVDPGVGFGKALLDNPVLIKELAAFRQLGFPVLVGASRKRFIGELTGVTKASDRVYGSVGVALAAALRGASVLRVHDVSATIQALQGFVACIDE